MDDAQHILVLALAQAGIVLPRGVVTLQDVESAALMSICLQAVAMIKAGEVGASTVPPASLALPQLMSERFKLCMDLAASLQELGYAEDISFQQFLYPSETSTYKIIRFLLEKLSTKSSIVGVRSSTRGQGRPASKDGDAIFGADVQATVKRALSRWLEAMNLKDGNLITSIPVSKLGCNTKPFRTHPLQLSDSENIFEGDNDSPLAWKIPSEKLTSVILDLNSRRVSGEYAASVTSAENQIQRGQRFATLKTVREDGEHAKGDSQSSKRKVESSFLKAVEFTDCQEWLPHSSVAKNVIPSGEKSEELESSQQMLPSAEKYVSEDGIAKLEERLASLVMTAEKLDIESLEEQKKAFALEKTSIAILDVSKSLQKQAKLMQKALDMAVNSSDSAEDSLEAYKQVMADKGEHLLTFKMNWERNITLLEKSIQDLEEMAQKSKSGTQDKLNSIEEMRQGCKEMTLKIQLREDEIVEIESVLEKLPKQAARSTYVRRIIELVKNCKKQDADISQIIQETRKLQRETNSVQERLHRTHALVDELVFRDAKKSAVCRQAYRLLSSVHENFADIVEKISQTDKLGHEIQELQARLELMEKESVDVTSVEADINAVSKENEALKVPDNVQT